MESFKTTPSALTFIVEFDWRLMEEQGNAGFLIWADPLPAVGRPVTRGIEIEIGNRGNAAQFTSHGDILPVCGAEMTPDPRFRILGSRSMPKEEDLHAKPTGEWNHYRITALDGSVTLEVNGHVVTAGSQCTPAKGYLCLESAGSEVHFRNFRIWELPVGSHAADEHRTAHKAASHKPLYNGLDLDDWKVREGQRKSEDWRLTCAAGSGEIEVALPKKAGHLFFDFNRANRSGGSPRLPFRIGNARFDQVGKGDGRWLRVHVHLTDSEVAVEFGGLRQVASRKKEESPRLTLVNDGAAIEFCNLFARAE